MMQPKRRRARQGRWRQVMRRQEASGLSIARFCERERITPTTFYRWKRALLQSDSTPQRDRRAIRKVAGRQPDDSRGDWLPVSVVAEACALAIEFPQGVRVEVKSGCDRELLRDVLAALVEEHLGQDPQSGHLFLFFHRRRDRVKILFGDGDGLVLWYKRLEIGSFPTLRALSAAEGNALGVEIRAGELALLLEGVDPRSVVRRRPLPQFLPRRRVEYKLSAEELAGPSLLAHVIDAKYAQHKPLYRQEDDLARHGVLVRRSTLWGWLRGAAECAWPLYQLLVRRVLASHVLGTDDTPVKVLDPELEHTRTGRSWTYIGDERHALIAYDYTPHRKRDGPQAFLQGFQGVLQADAFGGYDGIYWKSQGTILEAGCNAHARRKFFDSRETAPQLAREALGFFQRLYAVEDEAAGMSDEERLTLRRTKSVPIVEALAEWLREKLVLVRPKSPIAGAIKYCLRHWEALTRFTSDGSIPLDNNRSERALKEQALGRRNWLFWGATMAGARQPCSTAWWPAPSGSTWTPTPT